MAEKVVLLYESWCLDEDRICFLMLCLFGPSACLMRNYEAHIFECVERLFLENCFQYLLQPGVIFKLPLHRGEEFAAMFVFVDNRGLSHLFLIAGPRSWVSHNAMPWRELLIT
jgi:hypothetical protein